MDNHYAMIGYERASVSSLANTSCWQAKNTFLPEGQQEKSPARWIGEYIHNCAFQWNRALFGTPAKKSQIISRKGVVHPLPHITPAQPGLLSSTVSHVQQTTSSLTHTMWRACQWAKSFFGDQTPSPSGHPGSFLGIISAQASPVPSHLPVLNEASAILPLDVAFSYQRAPAIAVLSNDTLVVVWHESNSVQGSTQDGLILNPSGAGNIFNALGISSNNYRIIPVTLILNNDGVIYTDLSGNGVLTGNSGGFGTINYITGAINLPIPQVYFTGTIYSVHIASNLPAASNIRARFFDFKGQPKGNMFAISTINNHYPNTLQLSNNRFVTVYDDESSGNPVISGKIFNNYQQPVGSPFVIDSNPGHFADLACFQKSVKVPSTNSFVVVWEAPNASNYQDIKMRLYDSNGSPISSAALVNTQEAFIHSFPTVVSLPDGGFVVYWRSFIPAGGSSGGTCAKGCLQFYDANGQRGVSRVLNANRISVSGNTKELIKIAVLENRIVVPWNEVDGSVKACLYDFSGNLIGRTIEIAPPSSGFNWRLCTLAQVSENKNLWVAVYNAYGQGVEVGGSQYSSVIKLFNQNGVAHGKWVFTGNSASSPAMASRIASMPNNRFAVVWQDGNDLNFGSSYLKIFQMNDTDTTPSLSLISETQSYSENLFSRSESGSEDFSITKSVKRGSKSNSFSFGQISLSSLSMGQYSKTFSTITLKPTRSSSYSQSQVSTVGAIIVSHMGLQNISHFVLSPNGDYLLAVGGNRVSLIAIAQDDALSVQQTLNLTTYPVVSCFSNDERSIFVADALGNVTVIDTATMQVKQSFAIANMTALEVGPNGSLFVGTHEALLEVDVSSPVMGGTLNTLLAGGPVTSIKSFGRYVAMSSQNRVFIVSLNNKHLRVIKQIELSDTSAIKDLFALEKSGTLIAQQEGLAAVINATDVSQAFIQGSLVTEEAAQLAISENYLLSKSVVQGIEIYQKGGDGWISDVAVGFIPTNGKVAAFAFSQDGTYGVIVDEQGLKKFRVISNQGRLSTPLFKRAYTVMTETSLHKILFNQRKGVMLLGGNGVVQVMSSSHFANPAELSSIAICGVAEHMVYFPDKTKVIIVDSARNVTVADLFNPTQPQIIGTYRAAHPVESITLHLNQLLLCEGVYGIEFIDITDPSHMKKKELWETNGRAAHVIYNRNASLMIVADGSNGVDLYDSQRNLLFNIPTPGSASRTVLSPDEKTLYIVDGWNLRQFRLFSPFSVVEMGALSFERAIEDVLISATGGVAYVAAGTSGVFAVDTQKMVVGASLPTDSASSLALVYSDVDENQILVSNSAPGSLVVADLISKTSLIAFASNTYFPVGVGVTDQVRFYDTHTLEKKQVAIIAVQFLINGDKQPLPYWLSENDLRQGVIRINPPTDYTGRSFTVVFTLNVNGVEQDIPYSATIVPSLQIKKTSGKLAISTPSERITLKVTLQGNETFIPTAVNAAVAVSIYQEGKAVSVSGSTDDVNAWFQLQRITGYSALATVTVNDWFNIYTITEIVGSDIFALKQPPVAVVPYPSLQVKPLDAFKAFCNAFFFNGNDTLTFSMPNVPKGLLFDSSQCSLSGVIDKSLVGKEIDVPLIASDSGVSIAVIWKLQVASNLLPIVLEEISKITIKTGERQEIVLSAFKDPKNHTLVFSLSSSDGNDLPSFCSWNSEKNTLTLAPQLGSAVFTNPLGDAGSYDFIATATDELGGNVSTSLPLEVVVSKEDLAILILSYIGIAGSLIGIGATLFKWRAVLSLFRNIFNRQKYWREDMPLELYRGEIYYPTDPATSQRIPLEEIRSIQVFRLHSKGVNLLSRLSTYLNYSEQKEHLLNANLPHFVTVSDAGGIAIDFAAMEKSQKQAFHKNGSAESLFLQVTGYDGRILEMFEIPAEPLSVDTASVELVDLLEVADQKDNLNLEEESSSTPIETEEESISSKEAPAIEKDEVLFTGLNRQESEEESEMTDLRKAYAQVQ